MPETKSTDFEAQAKREIEPREVYNALIAERVCTLELRGLLEEAWTTLSDVCEFHGDPEYHLDVEATRELMKRIHAAKRTEPMILATAKGSELLRIWRSPYNELQRYAKHLTGCGLLEGNACDCGLLIVLG